MNKFAWVSAGLTVLAVLAAAPASAQNTWNFGNGGNCDLVGSKATQTCSLGTNNTLRAEGYAASAGGTYVRGTLTDQGGSGMGFTAPSETVNQPQHAFDNDGKHELLLLNFGFNKVVITGVALGWSYNDTDLSLLRWAGTGAPSSMPSMNVTTASLLSSGWVLVGSGDLDGTNVTGNTYGQNTTGTGVAANAANSSSWWIISSYFGPTVNSLDAGNDYYKLLAVHTTCVSNTSGDACNTVPRDVPEPGSLALAGLALAGLAASRRRKKVA